MTQELQALLAIAKDKGHTPSRAQMRQALSWLDQVQREPAAQLEALILRCDSRPPAAALQLKDWQFPERCLRLRMRWISDPDLAQKELHAELSEALDGASTALLRQCLRAIGRYTFADLMDRALEDPRLLSDPGLRRIALDSAARCAGQSPKAAHWVKAHAIEGSRESLLAQRESYRCAQGLAAWSIPDHARWLAGMLLRLRFKEGMHDWVIREIKARAGLSLVKIGRGELLIRSTQDRPYAEILNWRSVMDHAFVQSEIPLENWVASPRLQEQLQELYGDQPIPFRVALPQQGRQAIWRAGAAICEAFSQLINEPRGSRLELGQDPEGRCWARPRLRDLDRRFAYRVAEIPAASHPSVAAGLAAAAEPKAGDRIWDPFVGSGLELIEAGLRANCQQLLGSDLDPQALAAAQANAQAAGVELDLRREDARHLRLPPLDKVISNPPHGRRVAQDQDLQALYLQVFEQAWAALVPGGEIHWLCPQPQWLHSHCMARGGQSDILARIDLGGVVVCYQRLRKEP